jgi:hypothetical protein
MIKGGLLSQIPNYHRITIDKATEKKNQEEIFKECWQQYQEEYWAQFKQETLF